MIKEGTLYKVINIFGKTFEVYYGYYDEKDKLSKYSEPIPIFPDFIKGPQYSDDGKMFVTYMQDKCKYFLGNQKEEYCYKCKYFTKGEDLIGICECSLNKKEDK